MDIYFYIGQCRKQRAAKCECRIVIDHSFRTERPVANTEALCALIHGNGDYMRQWEEREREKQEGSGPMMVRVLSAPSFAQTCLSVLMAFAFLFEAGELYTEHY